MIGFGPRPVSRWEIIVPAILCLLLAAFLLFLFLFAGETVTVGDGKPLNKLFLIVLGCILATALAALAYYNSRDYETTRNAYLQLCYIGQGICFVLFVASVVVSIILDSNPKWLGEMAARRRTVFLVLSACSAVLWIFLFCYLRIVAKNVAALLSTSK